MMTPEQIKSIEALIEAIEKNKPVGESSLVDDTRYAFSMATAANESLPALRAAVNPWQPISSAPKDGTKVLVWRPYESTDHRAEVGVDLYHKHCWWRSRRLQQPTHWMPLPQPPQQED